MANTHEVIRRSVFETNSSSTHSICIPFGVGLNDDIIIPSDGILRLYGGEFGWGPEKHRDAETKLSYLVTFLMSGVCQMLWSSGYTKPTIKYNWEDEKYKKYFPMLEKVLRERYPQIEQIIFEPTEGYYPFGYIDHQSDDTPYDAFESEDHLKNFLFNRNSVLYIDHDNH